MGQNNLMQCRQIKMGKLISHVFLRTHSLNVINDFFAKIFESFH